MIPIKIAGVLIFSSARNNVRFETLSTRKRALSYVCMYVHIIHRMYNTRIIHLPTFEIFNNFILFYTGFEVYPTFTRRIDLLFYEK